MPAHRYTFMHHVMRYTWRIAGVTWLWPLLYGIGAGEPMWTNIGIALLATAFAALWYCSHKQRQWDRLEDIDPLA